MEPGVALAARLPSTASTERSAAARAGWMDARSPGSRSARRVPREAARRTAAPTAAWASRKGTPSRTRASARSTAVVSVGLGVVAHGRQVRLQPGDQAGQGAEGADQDVGGLEGGRLVLLQVAGIGQGQALEGGQEPGQAADDRARPAPDQLGHVGVALLGEHARPGRPGVGQPDPAASRPQGDVLGQPGGVGHGDGRRGQQLGDRVPVGGGVHGVVEGGGEAEGGGGRRRVERERRPGDGPGPERADVGPAAGVLEATHVPAQGEAVRGELEGPAAPAGPAGGG